MGTIAPEKATSFEELEEDLEFDEEVLEDDAEVDDESTWEE